MELTRKQRELHEAIKAYIATNGYPPTTRELCEALGNKSPATVYQKLTILKRKGYITFDTRKMRTIKILKEAEGESWQ